MPIGQRREERQFLMNSAIGLRHNNTTLLQLRPYADDKTDKVSGCELTTQRTAPPAKFRKIPHASYVVSSNIPVACYVWWTRNELVRVDQPSARCHWQCRCSRSVRPTEASAGTIAVLGRSGLPWRAGVCDEALSWGLDGVSRTNHDVIQRQTTMASSVDVRHGALRRLGSHRSIGRRRFRALRAKARLPRCLPIDGTGILRGLVRGRHRV